MKPPTAVIQAIAPPPTPKPTLAPFIPPVLEAYPQPSRHPAFQSRLRDLFVVIVRVGEPFFIVRASGSTFT